MKESLRTWHPSPEEVERIVAEMRPIIERFAARDARLRHESRH